jgi:hypothetical protein
MGRERAETTLFPRGLLDRPKLGQRVAAEKPGKIDREYLMRFPQFVEFISKSPGAAATETGKGKGPSGDAVLQTTTPEE